VKLVDRTVERIDRSQRERPWLSFPLGVAKKFGEDRAGNLAALIAYYGFFSMFPLLLVFVSLLGIFLHGNPDLAESIRKSVLSQFPVIGSTLKVKALRASGIGLGVGMATALWAGLGVTSAAQNAMNDIWGVKMKDRPNFFMRRIRGILVLLLLGVIVLASTIASGFSTSSGTLGWVLRVAGILVSLGLNLVLYLLSFRILTRKKLSWGDVFPGAAVGAVLWTLLQSFGGYYVGHQVKNASEVYGTFALVIGLLVWIYLGAQVTLYCAEINVVRKYRLWPRSLSVPPFTDGDKRTLEFRAQIEERYPQEDVEVEFEPGTQEGRDRPSDRPAKQSAG